MEAMNFVNLLTRNRSNRMMECSLTSKDITRLAICCPAGQQLIGREMSDIIGTRVRNRCANRSHERESVLQKLCQSRFSGQTVNVL